MGDNSFNTVDTAPPGLKAEALNINLVHELMPTVGGNDLGSKLGRVAEVTAKGLGETPKGVVNAAVDFVKPENWGKDAMTIGTSAALGAVMRVALPESGAVTATVGLVMGGMFLKDGATPIAQAWSKVWGDGSNQTMDTAAKNMGAGLGQFAVEGGVSLAAAGAATKFTPDVMTKLTPETWSKIEAWKTEQLGAQSLGAGPQTGSFALEGAKLDLTKAAAKPDGPIVGSSEIPLNSARTTDVSAFFDGRPSVQDMPIDQLKNILRENQARETTQIASGDFSRFGIKGSDGNYHSADDAIGLLLQGKDPRTEAAGIVATAKSIPLTEVNLAHPSSITLDNQAAGLHTPADDTADVSGKRGHGKGKVPAESDSPEPKTGDKPDTASKTGDKAPPPQTAGDKGTDAAGKPVDTTTTTDAGAKVTAGSRLLNAKTMAAQAEAIKVSLAKVSDQDGLIMDAMNRNLGAIDVRTNPDVKPLKGYDVARRAAFDLAQQVGTDPESFMQVNGLYDRFAAGALQSGSNASDIAAHVIRMDQYASENFHTYRQNIIDAGIDPDVALAQKPAPPLVEGTSDVQQVGTDKNGNPVYSHEGPHTLRSIYGPNGEPVWPLDMVKTPIREIDMRGVNTSGIYGHEYMHDQFGQMAKFDPEVRDAKLGDAAAKAWGADANKMMDMPNGGKDPQQVLLDGVVRQMAKIDPADHDAFLTQSLGLDAQTRVMRGARAADELLGPAGRTMVQVSNSGKMPLEVLVGNVAAMADTRAPSEVLLEMQGRGTPADTAKAVSDNVDKILGANGAQQIPLADGTHISLKDAVLKVSEQTRNPKFDTYNEPIPAQMSNKDVLVNVAKAWADETFADWGAAAESGQSAAPYFQALSKDGLLRSATVMGQEMRGPDNPLGIEAHPIDTLRPRYQAALIRALATAKGQHDQVLLDWADALGQYSSDAAKPGPITIASMDTPGQKIQIPQEVFDKFIPELVEAQLNTPLPRLQGKTLFDILPDLRKNFRINDGIADQWATAIQTGKGPDGLPFDAAHTKMTNVYGAGQMTFLKLVSSGMDATKANDAVNQFSDFFGDKIVADRASAPQSLAQPTPKLSFAAMARGAGDGNIPSLGLDTPSTLSLSSFGSLEEGPSTDGAPNLSRPNPLSQAGRYLWNSATSVNGAAAFSAYQIQDLLGLQKVQKDVLNQNE